MSDDDEWTSAGSAPLTARLKTAGDRAKHPSAAAAGDGRKNGSAALKKAKTVKRKRRDAFELVLPDEEKIEE